jgi:hypothetical protein
MKLRWVKREEVILTTEYGRYTDMVKVLQYWDEGKWVDVPTEVEEV